MTAIDWLSVTFVLAGLGALVAGQRLRNRQVRAEHWLWKKQRLLRARLLSVGGGAVMVVSAVAIVVT